MGDPVCDARDPALFTQPGIPRSTAASWIRRGARPVVTTELFGEDEQQLRARVLKLERRVQLLLGIVRLVSVPVRLFGFRLDSQRVPTGEAKSTILGAIERAALRRIEAARTSLRRWQKRYVKCGFDGLVDWRLPPGIPPLPSEVRGAVCTLRRADPNVEACVIVEHIGKHHQFAASETTVGSGGPQRSAGAG